MEKNCLLRTDHGKLINHTELPILNSNILNFKFLNPSKRKLFTQTPNSLDNDSNDLILFD